MKTEQNASLLSYSRWRNRLKSWTQSISNYLDDGKQKSPIYVLDGVRAIACFLVVFFHINFVAREGQIWYPIHDFGSIVGALALFGQSGVILFFLLSGFLLFLPYAKSMLFDSTWPSLVQFYLRRVFRILPAYFVALILMVAIFHPEYLHQSHWHQLWLFFTFRMDFPETFEQINGPFWTLAIEFQFYLLLPLVAWLIGLVVRRGTVHWRLLKLSACLLILALWGLGSRYWGVHIADTSQWDAIIPHAVSDALKPYIYGTTGKFFEVFAIGMFICVLYVYVQNNPIEVRWKATVQRLSPLIFLSGIIWLFWMALWHFYTWYFNYTMHFLDPYRDVLVNGWDQWEAICFALGFGLCMFAILFGTSWLKRPFELAPLRWLGLISFSLYIWHVPLLYVFIQRVLPKLQAHHWHSSAEYALLCLWTVLVIVPFSLFLYRTIELPWMRLGEKLRRKIMGKSLSKQKQTKIQTVSGNDSVSIPTSSNEEIPGLEVAVGNSLNSTSSR